MKMQREATPELACAPWALRNVTSLVQKLHTAYHRALGAHYSMWPVLSAPFIQ
jgi:hypothetical protein